MGKKIKDFWPSTLRAVAMAMAALAMAWGVTVSEGLIAAMVGAAIGVVVGQRLGRSHMKLSVIVGGAGVLLVGGWALAAFAVGTETFPRMLGPAFALRMAGMVRFGTLALALTTGFRAAATRKPSFIAVELGFITLAITTLFASHRDGVIARPLWLSDWAWRVGMDPAQILLGVGVVAVGLLAILLLVETRSGRSISSLVVLTILATAAVFFVNVATTKPPDPLNDLGLKTSQPGDPPVNVPPPDPSGKDPGGADGGGQPDGGDDGGGQSSGLDAGADGGGQPDAGEDGGGSGAQDGGADGGGQPDAGEDGGGSGAPDAGDAGGTPASNDGGTPPPPPNPNGDPNGGGEPPPSSQEQMENDDAPSTKQTPMAVVLLETDYSPPAQAYYFREQALSQFNGSKMVEAARSDFDRDVVANFPTERTLVPETPDPAGRKKVRTTVVLLHDHAHPFGLESPTLFAPAPNPNPTRFTRAYKVESLSQQIDYRKLFGRTGGDKRWSKEVRDYYLTGPTDPRYKQLADKIVAKLPPQRKTDPFALAVAVKLHLDKDLTYSTKQRHAGVPDPTADFLFGNKIGYCVHFAHAAVYLWRSLGVPSRIGVGYKSDEDGRRGGSTILIRSGDAHAWPEIYLEGLGWIVLDIAAERNLDKPGQQADEDLQKLLGEMARNQPPDPEEPPPKKKEGKKSQFGKEIGIAGLWLLGAALVGLYLFKIYRRIAPVFASARSMPKVGYRAALDKLADSGLTREFGETREGFAERAAALSPSFTKLTSLHVAARLRNPALDPGAREELQKPVWKATLRAVRKEISQRSKGYRRWLGLVNPVSFMDSR